MSYGVLNVANEFIRQGREQRSPVDPLKLQKLVYLAHGWHLAFTEGPLIGDSVEAWRYGPVVPKLYRRFKSLKASPITEDALNPADVDRMDAMSLKVIEAVWQAYGAKSSIDLSMLTHESGSAWDIVRRAANEWESPAIPNELIREEFMTRRDNGGHLR